jgi:hypothetical protein
VRALVGSVVSLALLAAVGGGLFASPAVSPSRMGLVPAAVADTAADSALPHRSQPDAKGVVDLYGNEVDEAIATYSLDPAGSPYEVHSPQTELPRLASPKS